MATLRELRTQAKEMGIAYTKETTPDQLQEMIVEKMCTASGGEGSESEPALAPPAARAPITVVEPPVAVEVPAHEHISDHVGTAPPHVMPGISMDENNFAKEVAINEGDLNTEFKNQASKFVVFATEEAKAKAKVMTAKLRLEVVSAEMTKKIREKLISEGIKPTEKMIESEVITSPEYSAAQQALIQANCDADIARGAKEAFIQRKDMLIQLGSAKRQEMDQIGMSLKDRVKEVISKAS